MKKYKCLYLCFFSFVSIIQSATKDTINPSLGPDALGIYIEESMKNFENLTKNLTDFKELTNLQESFKNTITRGRDLADAHTKYRKAAKNAPNSYMGLNDQNYNKESDALSETRDNLSIILNINSRWLILSNYCYYNTILPIDIKLVDGFSWDQFVEEYNEFIKAVEVFPGYNRITSDTKENRVDYLNAKQKYHDAFYCLNDAIDDFSTKLRLSQKFIDHKSTQQSIKLIELINDEFTKLHKIYPKIVDYSFRHYKDLCITYVFTCYFNKFFNKLFLEALGTGNHLRILLFKNSIISKTLEEAASLIDHVIENKPLKDISFSLFKKMLCCIIPSNKYLNKNGKMISTKIMLTRFIKTKNFDQMRLILIEAKKLIEGKKYSKNRERMLKEIDFCIFFFNIIAEKSGINGIEVGLFASRD